MSNRPKNLRNSGFTLIELLVVISIIGLMSSVVIASVNIAREKAKIARSMDDMRQLTELFKSAQYETGLSVRGMIGGTWNASPCDYGGRGGGEAGNLKNVPDTDPCAQAWTNLLTSMNTRGKGAVQGALNLKRDPWGSPYMYDQNEDENEVPGVTCKTDVLIGAGPDGFYGYGPASNDIRVTIPRANPCP